jgi:hypothetical protein
MAGLPAVARGGPGGGTAACDLCSTLARRYSSRAPARRIAATDDWRSRLMYALMEAKRADMLTLRAVSASWMGWCPPASCLDSRAYCTNSSSSIPRVRNTSSTCTY